MKISNIALFSIFIAATTAASAQGLSCDSLDKVVTAADSHFSDLHTSFADGSESPRAAVKLPGADFCHVNSLGRGSYFCQFHPVIDSSADPGAEMSRDYLNFQRWVFTCSGGSENALLPIRFIKSYHGKSVNIEYTVDWDKQEFYLRVEGSRVQ